MKLLFVNTLALAAAILSLAPAAAQEKTDLIPLPVHVIRSQGEFTVTGNTAIYCDRDRSDLADYLNDHLGAWLGSRLKVKPLPVTGNLPGQYIELVINPAIRNPLDTRNNIPAEGYILRADERGVRIEGVDRGGLFYGIQTLLQLLPADVYKCKKNNSKLIINSIEIADWPRFTYRGMSLDVARTFISTANVKLFIDRMSRHKLNRLHWHLTDDEGWRIEIESYPELAKRGGFRGRKLPVQPIYGAWTQNYGGYYTQDEIREVVAYAAMRNVEIIPEIDLPGHSRAFARLHPEILCPGLPDTTTAGYDRRNVLCATREANYKILGKVLAEVCALFPSQYVNIGCDEVEPAQWLGCPTCSAMADGKNTQPILDHFTGRLTEILAAHGKKPAVWDEAAAGGRLTREARVHAWQSVDAGLKSTENGYRTVFMPGSYFYFDMKQSPWEPGMTWAGLVDTYRVYSLDFDALGFTSGQMEYIEGVEGAFFGELMLPNGGQPYFEYQTYPRICALAEVAWTQPALRDATDFHYRLWGRHADRLSAMNINFRVPPPDVYYAGGNINVTYSHRHTGVRFTYDGTTPDRGSEHFSCPIRSYQIERFRFRSYLNDACSADVPVIIRHADRIEAGSRATFSIPLPPREGLWYLRIRTTEPTLTINTFKIESAAKTDVIIRNSQRVNEMHQLRVYVTPQQAGGYMKLDISNTGRIAAALSFQLEYSPYIEPDVKFTCSLGQNGRFPFANVTDYNFTSYARTNSTCRKGDHFTFTFSQTLECQSIRLHTGLFYMPRYHIPEGRVEISRDGETFSHAGDLSAGIATISPKGKIKAVRIVCTVTGNAENSVAIQDLKIIPKYK